jgi:hypothetical protein
MAALRPLCFVGLVSSPWATAEAQFAQPSESGGGSFLVDATMRQEWTDGLEVDPVEDRRLARLLARLELSLEWLSVGVGGDFNYGSDDNAAPPEGETERSLIRDNYRSRDARLDLAYARISAGRWLRLEGGRFAMPVPLTEMLWDGDLRPQGGAATIAWHRDRGSLQRLSFTALGARGSHVFEDDGVNMVVLSGGASFQTGSDGFFDVTGSFVRFTDLETLEPMLWRQNSRGGAGLARGYDVMDVVVRLRSEGEVSSELVADLSWNRKREADARGLWLGLAMGSTSTARGRLEYAYAKVDKDAVLGAYAGDDFLWGTGWEGHRTELGLRTGDASSLHIIGQLQRFKDAPDEPTREVWVKRLRVEMRYSHR